MCISRDCLLVNVQGRGHRLVPSLSLSKCGIALRILDDPRDASSSASLPVLPLDLLIRAPHLLSSEWV